MPPDLVASVTSFAVTVWVPAVLKVRFKFAVPAFKAVLTGKPAFGSEHVTPIMSLTELITFQFASTALTVTLKAVPAACGIGDPDFPVAVPGAALSPGINNRNFVNAPELTAMPGLMLAGIEGWVMSDTVTVELPAVFKVKLTTLLPLTRLVSAGTDALESEEARWMVSVRLEATFQNASTALTVTLNAVPAV